MLKKPELSYKGFMIGNCSQHVNNSEGMMLECVEDKSLQVCVVMLASSVNIIVEKPGLGAMLQ